MILEQETFNKYGYNPLKLKKFSHKIVIYKCDFCDKKEEKQFHILNRKRKTKDSCSECVSKKFAYNNPLSSSNNRRLYNIWRCMLERCRTLRKDNKNYTYIERKIKVCEDWKIFKNFLIWAQNNGYQDNLTIDRIDAYKGYFPENCRWITQQENSRLAGISQKGAVTKLRKEINRLKEILIKNNIAF